MNGEDKMKCPYCRKELETGFVQSPREIAWVRGKQIF